MIDRVDRNVQRLLHMLTGIKRLNRMLEGVSKETFLDDLRLQDASAFDIIAPVLVNKAECLYERGEGTIRYEGKWDLIDMFLVSHDLDKDTRMEICQIPFLMTREKKHPGVKPLRTYSGPRYNGGVSDHCPIVLLYSE